MKFTYQDVNFELPGSEHKVRINTGIKSKDQAGATSSAIDSFEGFQAIVASVSLTIPFKNHEELTTFKDIYQKTSNTGTPVVWRVLDTSLNPMGVDQVKFHGGLSVTEGKGLKQWEISFQLKEFNAKPALMEARAKEKQTIAAVKIDSKDKVVAPMGESTGLIADFVGAGSSFAKWWFEEENNATPS